LGFAVAGGVAAGILLAHARGRRPPEQRHPADSSVQADRVAPHGGIDQPHEGVPIPQPPNSAPTTGWAGVLRRPWI
jgi:hypothetical protein